MFSYPSYPSSLAVLVPAKVSPSDGWFFTRPFSWQVSQPALDSATDIILLAPLLYGVCVMRLRG